MSRSFYCHQCALNVQVNLTDLTCRRCSSGFIERKNEQIIIVRNRPDVTERSPAVNRGPELTQRTRIDLLQQWLNELQTPSQSTKRFISNILGLILSNEFSQGIQTEDTTTQNTSKMVCPVCYNNMELDKFNCLIPCGHFLCQHVSIFIDNLSTIY